MPATGRKIAVVGAGPAGLTAAFYLVRLGHDVTVYDDHEKGGGICRYGIPAYRLPKDVLDKELVLFEKLGVKFKYNTRIGKDISYEKLTKDNDIVYIAVGAHKDQELDIPGKELKGVYPGYEFLEDFAQGKEMKAGNNVVIIGAGNVAIDAARSVLRTGAKVTIVYRRGKDSMPANETEIKDAEAEGIEFKFFSGPNKIIGNSKGGVMGMEITVMKAGGFDESGRRKPVATDRTEIVECDTVILAIGEKVDSSFAAPLGIETNKNGTLKAHLNNFRVGEKLYAGGDAVSGPATAAEAMGMAKKAADAIDAELMGISRFNKLFRVFEYRNVVPFEPLGGKMNRSKHLPVKERVNNFQEVLSGYSGEQAKGEASRCLRCDVKVC
jgi:NADH-quinone oxidoreductase subunit F